LTARAFSLKQFIIDYNSGTIPQELSSIIGACVQAKTAANRGEVFVAGPWMISRQNVSGLIWIGTGIQKNRGKVRGDAPG
jgi:hypothetical protein